MITTNDVLEECFKDMDDKGKLEFIEGYCSSAELLAQQNNSTKHFYRARILKELFNLAGETVPTTVANETEIVEDFSPAEVKRLITVVQNRLTP